MYTERSSLDVTSQDPAIKYSNLFKTNGLEKEIDQFKQEKLRNIKFSIVSKHIIISIAALFISFFLDISTVPVLGNVTNSIAKGLFPNWQPLNQSIQPISFWWIPFLFYGIFVIFAYKSYMELRKEVRESTSPEIIDKIINSSISVIDGVSTALPLIGAAILLISIKLGPEIFLGLSVPFEIKALIVLALGKLFEPVLDEMAVEFQHIINKANEMKTRYYAQTQVEQFQKIIHQLGVSENSLQPFANQVSIDELKKYEEVLVRLNELSRHMYNNFNAVHEIINKINSIDYISSQKISELSALSEKLNSAVSSLKEETTLKSLQSLESIIKK